MKFSENLRKIRKENNLSQEQLAEKVGVSRQAVSKWESGAAYPEMDKVLTICNLFNYSIDELMNENVSEVEEKKQSKVNFNKYVDDFLGFISKTTHMFSHMKFSQIVKCIIEQCIIALILYIIFSIIEGIFADIISGLFGMFSNSIFIVIRNILLSVYSFFALIISITIILYVFKTRYLDYYDFVNEDTNDTRDSSSEEGNSIGADETNENTSTKSSVNEKPKEKIVIRDPNDSGSKFLNVLAKIIVFLIRIIVACIAGGFCISFIGFATTLCLSFLIVKTGFVFLGCFLGSLSAMTINFVFLEIMYNFIVGKKCFKTRMFITFIVSLIVGGLSIGMIVIGATRFSYVETELKVEDKFDLNMTDNLFIDYIDERIEYKEENIPNIKIIVKHSEDSTVEIDNDNGDVCFYFDQKNNDTMDYVRDTLNNINNREIKEYSSPKIFVHASKANIEKMKMNKEAYEEQRKKERETRNQEVEIEVSENTIEEKEKEIEIENKVNEEIKTEVKEEAITQKK